MFRSKGTPEEPEDVVEGQVQGAAREQRRSGVVEKGEVVRRSRIGQTLEARDQRIREQQELADDRLGHQCQNLVAQQQRQLLEGHNVEGRQRQGHELARRADAEDVAEAVLEVGHHRNRAAAGIHTAGAARLAARTRLKSLGRRRRRRRGARRRLRQTLQRRGHHHLAIGIDQTAAGLTRLIDEARQGDNLTVGEGQRRVGRGHVHRDGRGIDDNAIDNDLDLRRGGQENRLTGLDRQGNDANEEGDRHGSSPMPTAPAKRADGKEPGKAFGASPTPKRIPTCAPSGMRLKRRTRYRSPTQPMRLIPLTAS